MLMESHIRKYGALEYCQKCSALTYHFDGKCQREVIVAGGQPIIYQDLPPYDRKNFEPC